MADFFAELKRRHIYRVAAAYAVVAWVLLQLFNNVAPILKLPDWAGTLVLVLLAGGFPVALIFAWILQLASAGGAPARPATGKFDWALMGALIVVIALVSYQQLAPSRNVGTAQQAGVAPSGISIAVLPFVNLSADQDQEFFSDGMTDEIMTALAKVPSLQVVARTSAFEFKGQNRNIQAIGQLLHARYVIDGSVRKAGNRVRIAAQLIQADNGVNVWADSFARELTDVFAIQEDIAKAIAVSLQVPLGLAQGDSLVRDRTKDLESYDQYLRARTLVRARGLKSLTDAIALLEQVVAHDPGFAPAWGLLAQACALAPTFRPELRGGSIDAARAVVETFHDKAERAAHEAIRLDVRNVLGYTVLARIQARRGKWAEAEDLHKKTLMLDPSEPEALDSYRTTLGAVGRLKEALSISEKVRALEPLVPAYAITVASYLQFNGQNAASIPILEAIPPNEAGGLSRNASLAQAYAAGGRYAEAADTLLLISGVVSRQSAEDAARLLRTAPTKAKAPEALPKLDGGLDFVYAYVGALDRGLQGSGNTLQFGFNIGVNELWLPVFAPARKTESFKRYVRDAGLVDYWKARGWPDLCHPTASDDFVCD